MMRSMTQIVLAALLATACAAPKNTAASNDRTLIDYMNHLHADYQPLSADEMIAEADVIVRGHVTAVRDGREIFDTVYPSDPYKMAVLEVTVTDVLKGEAGDRVYFEYIRGAATPEQMARNLPAEEVMLFLIPPRWDTKAYRFDFDGRGLPEGEPLYVLRTQQAMLLQAEGNVVQALEPDAAGTETQLFDSRSLDDVAAIIDGVLTSVPE